MNQLGYTWYPQDWWTSETFKRLKRFPMVRYALRELFDLMYKEGTSVEMNRDYLFDDFNIEFTDAEYNKLLEYIEVQEDGTWWISSIKKRISRAQAARENGKLGGRPKKTEKPKNKTQISSKKITQEPSIKTQGQNPNNPPLEREREREREREIKEKVKSKGKEKNARAISILNYNKESEMEVLKMQAKKQVKNWNDLEHAFNDKIDLEIAQGKIEMDPNQLMPRLRSFTRAWINNQGNDNQKFNKTPAPDSYESGKQKRV